MNETRFILWICGRIDPRYGEALDGVVHAAPVGDNRTLCGLNATRRETGHTIWWADDYGRAHRDADGATCGRCRRIAGLEPMEKSKVQL